MGVRVGVGAGGGLSLGVAAVALDSEALGVVEERHGIKVPA